MSARDIKESCYNLVTPESIKPVYEEHGREIANIVSCSRIIASPLLFGSAAAGKKGVLPGMARVLKIYSDGYDGHTAEHDKDFGQFNPDIANTKELSKQLAINLFNRNSGKQRLKKFWEIIGRADGSTVDQESDKAAQHADQIGCSINGDLSWLYTGLNLVRNLWVGAVRNTYRNKGISTAGSSTPTSQIKTVFMDTHQAVEAFGILDKYPKFRRYLEIGGIALTAFSALEIMYKNEVKYQQSINDGVNELSAPELILASTARTMAHIALKPQEATFTDQKPQLASDVD